MEPVKIIGTSYNDLPTKAVIGCAAFAKVPFMVSLSKGLCCTTPGKQGPLSELSHSVTLHIPTRGSICGQLAISHLLMELSGFLRGEPLRFERHDVLSWMEFVYNRLALPVQCPKFERVDARSTSEFAKTLRAINAFLLDNTFLAAEELTHADVYLVIAVDHFVETDKLDAALVRDELKHLARLMRTVHANEAFAKYVVVLEMLQGAEEFLGTIDTNLAEFIKQRVSASSFNLEEFKRLYSNCRGDLRKEVMPVLREKFDPEHFGFYKIKYNKLEDECKNEIMTSNMVSGFLQRFDPAFRKICFGVINVMGSGDCYDVEGVFLIQGKELPPAVTEHPSYEFHTFTKLDPSNPKDWETIQDFFCNSDEIGGVPIADCKVFK